MKSNGHRPIDEMGMDQFKKYIKALSNLELESLKLEIDYEIDSIKSQIEAARLKVIQEGVYSDSDWWRRANDARRFKGRKSQAIQLEFKRRRTQQNKSFERVFIDLARVQLDSDVFSALMEEAEEIAGVVA